MRLLIVRHGETDMNVKQRLAGHLPAVLTPRGVSQARALGERLSTEKLDLIYSSDLIRARQTTSELTQFINKEVIFDERLRERTWGAMDNASVSEYRSALELSKLPYHQFKTEGGESILDVLARAESFITNLLSRHEDKSILISGHHTLNKALLFYCLGLSWDEWPDIHQTNTCVNELVLDGPGVWRSVLINCSSHLSSMS